MLTQSEVAERAGISMYTVNAAEGGRGVSPKTGRALAAALGVEPEALLEEVAPPKVTSRPSPEAPEEISGEERPINRVSPEELERHIAHMEQLKEYRKHEMEALAHERKYDPQAWISNMELADLGLTRLYDEEGIFEFVERVNAEPVMTSDEVRRLCRRFAREWDELQHLTHEARLVAQAAQSRTHYESVKLQSGLEAHLRDNDTQRDVP